MAKLITKMQVIAVWLSVLSQGKKNGGFCQ